MPVLYEDKLFVLFVLLLSIPTLELFEFDRLLVKMMSIGDC